MEDKNKKTRKRKGRKTNTEVVDDLGEYEGDGDIQYQLSSIAGVRVVVLGECLSSCLDEGGDEHKPPSKGGFNVQSHIPRITTIPQNQHRMNNEKGIQSNHTKLGHLTR